MAGIKTYQNDGEIFAKIKNAYLRDVLDEMNSEIAAVKQ